MVFPPLSIIFAPTIELPVKEIMFTSALSTRAAPISGEEPTTTFTTPGGKIEFRTSPSFITARGSCGAGLIITVLPIAKAGAIFPATFTKGKLYGVIQATTPAGCLITFPVINDSGARALAAEYSGGSGSFISKDFE
jgi:hypothetical protein